MLTNGKVSIVLAGKLVAKSPTLATMALRIKLVLPVTRIQPARPRANRTLSWDRNRMPLSTPVVAETAAMTTARMASAICAPVPTDTPKSRLRPTLRNTTPMPSEVATPKIVPRTAAVSTACPTGPSIRRPRMGCSAERTASGSPIRWQKYPRAIPMSAYIPQPVIP